MTTETIDIITRNEFIKEHGLAFYTRFPTRDSLIEFLEGRIQERLNKSKKKPGSDKIFIENRQKYLDVMLGHFYDNKGYLHFLDFFYDRKLKVDKNSVFQSLRKQGTGIRFTPADKTTTGRGQFKNSGRDEGRQLITNLSYKEIFTCRKGSPVDILTWEALNCVFDLKHAMRPAFWGNVAKGDFDGRNGQKKAYDVISKIISMFCDKASVFNPKIYATLMNHYAPHAENSIHLVGSWCTPTLAAASLLRLKHQVVIDVIPRQKLVGDYINKTFIPDTPLSPRPKLDFIICPSEKLDERLDFSNKYKDYFDISIQSPVYFDTELYGTVDGGGGEQSVDSFPTYESWIEGYFHQTTKTAFEVMKPGAVYILVISDFIYKDKKTKKSYHISRDFLDITSKYFEHQETSDLILTSGTGFTKKGVNVRKGRELPFSEHVHVFRKREDGKTAESVI